jgi:hypothetical protein
VNASGLTASAEIGNIVRIIGGTGAGQTAGITANTSTGITVSPAWGTTPDSTSIFWIEAASWVYDYEGVPVTVGTLDASPVVIGNVPVNNYLGKSVLIEILTEDQNGNFAPEYFAPTRPIYVSGAQGTRTVTSSTTITPSDGTIQYDTSGGNITQALPAASLYPNQDLTFIKTTSDANTLTITGAISGSVVLTTQFQSATFHSDGTNWTIVNKLYVSPLVAKGDIYTRSSSADARLPIGSDGTFLVADSTQTTGQTWRDILPADLPLATTSSVGAVEPDGTTITVSAGVISLGPQPYDIPFSQPSKPGSGTVYPWVTILRSVSFPANFSGSRATVGTNPTSTATYTILKNGSSIGTVAISTSGTATFTTSGGGSVSCSAGDRLTIQAPSPQDATLSDVAITITGTR